MMQPHRNLTTASPHERLPMRSMAIVIGARSVGGVGMRTRQIIDNLCELGPTAVVPLDGATTGARPIWLVPDEPLLALPDPGADPGWMRDPEWDPTEPYVTDALLAHVSAAIGAFRPDVIVIDQLWLFGYADLALGSPARVVLNQHNVEADLQEQLAATAKHPAEKLLRTHFARRTNALETKALGAVDQVWVCSDADATAARSRYGTAGVVVPNTIRVRTGLPRHQPHSTTTPNLVFPGDFSYPPNVAAFHCVYESILPLLRRRLPGSSVTFAGTSPPAQMRKADADNEDVTVTGRVGDMRTVLIATDAMIVPLQTGSGSRFKLLEAFAAGLPVISTSKGAEGIAAIDGRHLMIADDIETFTDATVRLATDRALQQELSGAAWELVRSEYSWETSAKLVGAALTAL